MKPNLNNMINSIFTIGDDVWYYKILSVDNKQNRVLIESFRCNPFISKTDFYEQNRVNNEIKNNSAEFKILGNTTQTVESFIRHKYPELFI